MLEKETKMYVQLKTLKGEHRELDQKLAILMSQKTSNQLELQRIKKRKLQLRDEILRIENVLYPDIIA